MLQHLSDELRVNWQAPPFHSSGRSHRHGGKRAAERGSTETEGAEESGVRRWGAANETGTREELRGRRGGIAASQRGRSAGDKAPSCRALPTGGKN